MHKFILAVLLLAAFLPVLAQKQAGQPNRDNRNAAASSDPDAVARGEKVFQQNCSRCHNAPQGFSSRISGTILRHMRVRASLSTEDEKALLRFMNP